MGILDDVQNSEVIPNGVQQLPNHFSSTPQGVQGTRSKRVVRNASFSQVRFITNDTTEQMIFKQADNRAYLLIQNKSTSSIFIAFGQKANSNSSLELAAGDTFAPNIAPVNSIHIIGEAIGGQQIVIALEGKV